MSIVLQNIIAALVSHGLILRSGFVFDKGEDAPHGPSGNSAKSVLLVGQAGGAVWPHFLRWRETQRRDLKNPLDAWSRKVIGAVGQKFAARAVSPSDKPFLPFQQWAMRAEGLKPSPLGILMHPEYGLWHAYRGALLFDHEVTLPASGTPVHLCDLCSGKPCLGACPAGAYSETDFAYESCVAHVRSDHGETCRSAGCLARNACPYGAAYRYIAETQAFHMASFAGLGLQATALRSTGPYDRQEPEMKLL